MPQAYAEPIENYGESVITQALIWLPSDLQTQARDLDFLWTEGYLKTDPTETIRRLELFAKTAQVVADLNLDTKVLRSPEGLFQYSFRLKKNARVRFVPEVSGKFALFADPSLRATAATGTAVDSRVYFNLDRISDPEVFTLEAAVRLWVHEIGHKVRPKNPELTQADVDEIAVILAKTVKLQQKWMPVQAGEPAGLLVLNGKPVEKGGLHFYGPIQRQHGRAPTFIAWQEGARLWDISLSVERELDDFRGPYLKHFEILRHVNSIQVLHASAAEVEMLLDIDVFRDPVDWNHYELTSMGGPYRKLAHVRIRRHSHAAPDVEVLSYQDSLPPPERVDDATLHVTSFQLEPNGDFHGELEVHTRTERFFGMISYPLDSGTSLLIFAQGQSVPVPIDLKPYGDFWHNFPSEIYQKDIIKRARFSGQLPENVTAPFEILGWLAHHTRLGGGYDYDQFRPRLVIVAEPQVVEATCETALSHP